MIPTTIVVCEGGIVHSVLQLPQHTIVVDYDNLKEGDYEDIASTHDYILGSLGNWDEIPGAIVLAGADDDTALNYRADQIIEAALTQYRDKYSMTDTSQ